MIQEFQNSCFIDWRLNTNFIALIPEEPCSRSIDDYRPISLVNVMHMILRQIRKLICVSKSESKICYSSSILKKHLIQLVRSI